MSAQPLTTPAARSQPATLQGGLSDTPLELDDARRHFYSSLLSRTHSRPSDDLKFYCKCWKDFSHADWVWLWLFNDFGSPTQWELVAACADDETARLPSLVMPSENCVAELSILLRAPVRVPDLQRWSFTHQNQHYSITTLSSLRTMGCSSFLTLPLLFPQVQMGAASTRLEPDIPSKAAICLHYRNPADLPTCSDELLFIMASLTAEKILASYLTDQRNILLDLNKLSEPPLTTQGKYPDKDRHQYCESVINVIKQYLRAEYVSIFYRNPSTLFESVNCLASTGLYDAAGNLLTADELPAAQYWRHESLTGAVYATGRPQIFKMGRDYGRDKPKFRETPLGFPERSVSAIIYPIISALPDAQTLGVIRCTDCRDTLFQTQPANFNPGHAYVLDFISKQIAPVLETLATRLARETNISVVKHDLDTAVGRVRNSVFTVGLHLLKQGLVRNSETTLNLLRDTFQERSAYNAFIAGLEESLSHERLAETVEEGMLDEYKLPDLLLSCLKLHRLVSSLDPLDGLPYSPMPTYLEGDIVARVAAIWRRDFLVEKGIMLLYRPFKDVIPKLYVDRVLIERALENLLSNALKYGDRGTTVNIEPRAEPSGYFITVSSRGIEIEDCERDLIFTPGYRGKKAKERGFGLGIGLKVSRRIMEQHGGRLDLLSHRNPVTFGMFFPSKLRMMTK